MTYTRPPIYISLFDLTAGKEDAGWLQGCSKSFPVHACMVVVEGDSTRTSDSTMLMPRKREAWSHVTTPLIETDSIRCMRQPVPCTTPRLRRGRARGCPTPRSMRRPIHYLNLLLVVPGGGAYVRIHALLARSVLLCHVTRRCLLFFSLLLVLHILSSKRVD